MDPLMKIASEPLVVSRGAPVKEAVDVMVREGHGAVAVVDPDGRVVGVFTERDLLQRVAQVGLDPRTTVIESVMATEPICVEPGCGRKHAIEMMLKHGFRHLPITDEERRPVGMLSFRDLLRHQVERLRDEVSSLENYLLADSPGG